MSFNVVWLPVTKTSSVSTKITPNSSYFGDWNRLCNVRTSKVVRNEFVFSSHPPVIRFLRLTFAAVLSSPIFNHTRLFPLVVAHYGRRLTTAIALMDCLPSSSPRPHDARILDHVRGKPDNGEDYVAVGILPKQRNEHLSCELSS